jgi:hypothetical protein
MEKGSKKSGYIYVCMYIVYPLIWWKWEGNLAWVKHDLCTNYFTTIGSVSHFLALVFLFMSLFSNIYPQSWRDNNNSDQQKLMVIIHVAEVKTTWTASKIKPQVHHLKISWSNCCAEEKELQNTWKKKKKKKKKKKPLSLNFSPIHNSVFLQIFYTKEKQKKGKNQMKKAWKHEEPK